MAITPVTTNRLTGISSGMDTETLVESMLALQKARIEKQIKTKDKLEWKADSLRQVNSLIRSFRENHLSVLNPASNMMSASSYTAFSVTMLSSTNAFTVSAGSSATQGKVTVNKITNLAESAILSSKDAVIGDINRNATLGELADSFATPLEFDEESDDIMFSINGKEFTFNKEATLTEVMTAVNSSDAGVRMSFSSLTKGFTFTSKTTGSASKIEIVNLKGNAFAEGGAFGLTELSDTGLDAKLTINNVEVTRSNNTFTIDGITYTLNDEMASAVSFNVTQNVDATLDKIKSFIDSYNTLVGKLQDLIGEKVYRNFAPLTKDERAAMSENDIKLWEEKAKSGLLRNDSNISSLLTELRSAFYTSIEAAGVSPSSIGLNTSGYSSGAKITIDERKLRAAIENNPDLVAQIFTQTSKATDNSQKFKESGLVVRISNALLTYTGKATDISLATLTDQISDTEDMIESLEAKLATKEAALWARFSAMETALSKMNSQSAWLTSLLSSKS